MYGFAASVAERMGRLGPAPSPLIEANGTGGGFKIFCQSGPERGPDAVNATRPLEEDERQFCHSKGIHDFLGFIVGHDGIVLAGLQGYVQLDLRLEDLFKALSKVVLVDGKWVKNPYKKWSEIRPALPDQAIGILGVPPSSGTYAVLVDLILKPFCPEDLSKCRMIRTDGVYIQASEHENVVVQKLKHNPDKLAVFGYSFLTHQREKVSPMKIQGQVPTFESIRTASYPLSRPLYIYTTRHHIKRSPHLLEFLKAFYEPKASGKRGYLSLKGLVPPTPEEKKNMTAMIQQLELPR